MNTLVSRAILRWRRRKLRTASSPNSAAPFLDIEEDKRRGPDHVSPNDKTWAFVERSRYRRAPPPVVVAGLHSERLASFARDYDLVLRGESRFRHRFKF